MYNDYRDYFAPGTKVRLKTMPSLGEDIVAGIDSIVTGSSKKVNFHDVYKGDPYTVWILWPNSDFHDRHKAFSSSSDQIEIVLPDAKLCGCPWNKHPVFCKCK